MFSKLIGVALFGIAVHASLAQDPTKVEPKHYKLAFENEWVQVVDVHYGPHEVPGGSWIVNCSDPQGATFALLGPRR